MAGKKIEVDRGEPPVTKKVLAQVIIDISAAAKSLAESGLNEDAIVVLLRDRTTCSKVAIREVLQGLRDLKAAYCR